MASVRELFPKLFAYVLLFEQATVSGQAQRSYDQVRGDIIRLLAQHKATARREGMLEQEYQDAEFAAVAWTDETILKLSSWEHVNHWKVSPLQRELYNTQNAGELFFEPRLKGLRPDQKEVREIYYLALGLGFTGRYFLGREDELTLAQLRREQAQHLQVQTEEVQDIDKLTPQPYEVHPPPPPSPPFPWTNLLLKAGLALLVIVPLVLLLMHWITPRPVQQFQLIVRKSGSGSGAVVSADQRIHCGADCSYKYAQGTKIDLTAIPDPGSGFRQWSGDPGCSEGKITLISDRTCTAVFERERRPDEAIRKDVLERLANQQCAKIAVAVQAGAVSLSGRVASESQRGEVRGIVQGTPDVVQVRDTCDLIPRPFCQVLDLLEPFKEHAEKQGFGLMMQLDKPGDRPVYIKGNNLTVTVQGPGKFASYLYVDYYTAAPELGVGHLVPNRRIQAHAPGSAFTVDLYTQNLQIQQPFGLELLTVIASKTPLFTTLRSDEAAEAYLTELRRALPSEVATSEVAAAFYFIITRER